MAAALALARRGTGQTGLNPAVGCIITKNGRVISRGWTQPSGRPHAEAMAINAAGNAIKGASIYVTLEPCAHKSERGPSCAKTIIEAQPARVIIATQDPDPRTAGKGIALLREAGIEVETGILESEAQRALGGFFMRIQNSRPLVTLKLGMSLDGRIAMADGKSQWITGPESRAHTHLHRARHDAILVGGGTIRADKPNLNVRLAGLENRSPARYAFSSEAPEGWGHIAAPDGIKQLQHNSLMIEGGAQTAAAFLKADLVDRLLLYRAPIIIGGDGPSFGDVGLDNLADAHGRWILLDQRNFQVDCMELYERNRGA